MGWIDWLISEWMVAFMIGWRDGWMDEWMNEWMLCDQDLGLSFLTLNVNCLL
jgi:hypothetical protein